MEVAATPARSSMPPQPKSVGGLASFMPTWSLFSTSKAAPATPAEEEEKSLGSTPQHRKRAASAALGERKVQTEKKPRTKLSHFSRPLAPASSSSPFAIRNAPVPDSTETSPVKASQGRPESAPPASSSPLSRLGNPVQGDSPGPDLDHIDELEPDSPTPRTNGKREESVDLSSSLINSREVSPERTHDADVASPDEEEEDVNNDPAPEAKPKATRRRPAAGRKAGQRKPRGPRLGAGRQKKKNEEVAEEEQEDADGDDAEVIAHPTAGSAAVKLNGTFTEQKYSIREIKAHRKCNDIPHAFELSVSWFNSDETTWELERSLQAQAPDAVYQYWKKQRGGRPDQGMFRVFAVLKHIPAPKPGKAAGGSKGKGKPRGRPAKTKTKKQAEEDETKKEEYTYLVQWEGYSADPKDTSIETEAKLQGCAPDELKLYWEEREGDVQSEAEK